MRLPWSHQCLQTASKLIPMLCQNGAGLYWVNFPKAGRMKEVRVGWPNPKIGTKKLILAVMKPLSDGRIELELRVGQESGLISESGRQLKPATRDASKEGAQSQKDKGFRTLLLNAELPQDMEEWVKTALEFTKKKYGLPTHS